MGQLAPAGRDVTHCWLSPLLFQGHLEFLQSKYYLELHFLSQEKQNAPQFQNQLLTISVVY
jgi:hypothetical protein